MSINILQLRWLWVAFLTIALSALLLRSLWIQSGGNSSRAVTIRQVWSGSNDDPSFKSLLLLSHVKALGAEAGLINEKLEVQKTSGALKWFLQENEVQDKRYVWIINADINRVLINEEERLFECWISVNEIQGGCIFEISSRLDFIKSSKDFLCYHEAK